MPVREGVREGLNGDVYSVYVGKTGIILDDSGRRRVADLLKK
jgi:hypothetical protein